MAFERREILLIVGVVFIMVGTMTFLAPIFAAAIAVSAYFGIKSFVKWRKRQIKKAIGQGVCATCGATLNGNPCPNCDIQKGS